MGLLDGFEHFARESEPLAAYTWFRLGGTAEYFAEPTSVDELAAIVKRFTAESQPIRLIGSGSNVLIRDRDVPGLVIHLSNPAFGSISVDGQQITAGGGAKLGHVIATAVREGLAGLEELVGIPGTIGGALHGNSGTEASDIGQCTHAATVMTRAGEIVQRQRDDLSFAYRESSLDELVILDVQFQLEPQDAEQLTKRMQKLWIVKKASQPTTSVAAGCIFKSPGGSRAGDIIDQAGLKGASVGAAEVSDRDANFIVANAGATSADVLELIELMQSQVEQRLGVELQTQLEIW